MPNEEDLLDFLYNSEIRIGRLLRASRKMSDEVKFKDAADDLESKFIGSKAHFYGTRFQRLGHEKSHLNIFIDVDDSYLFTQNPEKIEEMMDTLIKYFKIEHKCADSLWMRPISTLKTPARTVRVVYKRGHLQCDITFDSGIGVENTKLIHHMFSLQPEAYKLYHFVRIWIHIDEFSFKRYLVGLLVIFYLQNKKLMPSVVQMQEDVKENFIGGWNVNFNDKKTIQDYGLEKLTDYEEHCDQFFKFYGKIDFSQNVICPFLGRLVPIKNYPDNDEDLIKYKDNIKSFNRQCVNVADLLNLNFNCAFGVGKKRAMKFTGFCAYAEELLKNNYEEIF